MTKSQKKLDRVKLTEEEKKAIKKFYRKEATYDAMLTFLAIIAGLVVILVAMEVL